MLSEGSDRKAAAATAADRFCGRLVSPLILLWRGPRPALLLGASGAVCAAYGSKPGAEHVRLAEQLRVLTPKQLGRRLRFRAGGGFVLVLARNLERLTVHALELGAKLADRALGFAQAPPKLGALLGLASCATSSPHRGRL
jgi:hypothetical protein